MKRCNHNFVPLMPSAQDLGFEGKRAADYYTAAFIVRRLFSDVLICTECKRTAHKINSNRGGTRMHADSSVIITDAAKIAVDYGFQIPFVK